MNILSRFGCPLKIITDNAATFKSKRMQNFCQDYNITLEHSTKYYSQGNRLAKSLNKSLTRITKRILQDNKKAWHKKLIYTLWEYRVTTKKSISTLPFQIIYGVDTIFPTSLGPPIKNLLQEQEVEPNDVKRRINKLIHRQEMWEHVYNQSQLHQERMKKSFDKHSKWEYFQVGEMVIIWDARNEDKGKHRKLDHLWTGPFKINAYCGNNAYFLEGING
jgi:transposase InsO family protein